MKTLNDYTDTQISAVMEKYGAFFAFGKSQFDENKVEGVKYISDGTGMIVPKDKYEQLSEEIENIYKEGIKQDISENGLTAIIKRELSNYECFYTGEIEDAVEALVEYGVNYDDVMTVFKGGVLS